MNVHPSAARSCRLANEAGLAIALNANGSPQRIDCGDILVNLFPGTEAEGGSCNIFLRVLDGDRAIEALPLLGPRSPSAYHATAGRFTASGRLGALAYRIDLIPAATSTAWFWHVRLHNHGDAALRCDLIHTQDVGIAHYGAIRLNEFYVSQYLDHTPLPHPRHGHVVATRQNQAMGGRHPWLAIGSLGHAVSYATDALQFHALASRAGLPAHALVHGLPGHRLQHEQALACIQDEEISLAPGAAHACGFFAVFVADHPHATGTGDLAVVDAAVLMPEARPPADVGGDPASTVTPAPALFATAPLFAADDLEMADWEAHFGPRRNEERDGDMLLGFFHGDNAHVVAKAKELRVLRPHGHLLRTGSLLTPDESALTSTAWMAGTFHSMVTQGHVSINRFLSTCHGYLGQFRGFGQRVFIHRDGRWCLLDVPSAFEMRPDGCRWIYRDRDGTIMVQSSAAEDCHHLDLEIEVVDGPPVRLLVTHHLAINGDDGNHPAPPPLEWHGRGVRVRAIPDSDVGRRFPDGRFVITPHDPALIHQAGGDALLFADGVSRDLPFVCYESVPCRQFGLRIEGRLLPAASDLRPGFWEELHHQVAITPPAASPQTAAVHRLRDILPWFTHNALVHYLSPRGLEQYSGGGWGTRDVSQGPVELLLALGHFAPVRDLLLRLFRQQNPDGDWPQWFMFFERERNIRPCDSHGDIVYWPVLALAQYILASGDTSILSDAVPYFHAEAAVAPVPATIADHARRALELIERRVVDHTVLAAYGHGDWNDALQPVRAEMREHLCSSWTVTLNYQTLRTLAAALRLAGRSDDAQALDARAATILAAFHQHLIPDEVTAGLAYFHEGGQVDYLLHPRDTTTGLSFSLLPMIHGIINGMFDPTQAATHLEIIRKYLLGPDGAHLFDRPMPYRGGLQHTFQRAESASFFGREIGIMYMHAHLRYCEALAVLGDAPAFFDALCLANPIGLRELVPSSAPRQSNCYFSSTDPAFADRYDAFTDYHRVKDGTVPLEGGWRVYSSGAGIAVRLLIQCFLGVRVEAEALVIDPVIPAALDGLHARLRLSGLDLRLTYHVGTNGCGPTAINSNSAPLAFSREPNRYRTGGARIALADLPADGDPIDLDISLG